MHFSLIYSQHLKSIKFAKKYKLKLLHSAREWIKLIYFCNAQKLKYVSKKYEIYTWLKLGKKFIIQLFYCHIKFLPFEIKICENKQ